MFKTKEELIKTKSLPNVEEPTRINNEFINQYNDGLDFGIRITFKSFAERVAFYKKYKYDWKSLFKEHENLLEIWSKSEEYPFFKEEIENANALLAEDWYQDWLYDYCFGDIK